MQSPISRRQLLAGGAGSALALSAGCTGLTPFVGQRLMTTLSLSADEIDRLGIVGRIGSITVTGEDREDIDVEVVKQASSLRTNLDDLSVETTVTDGRLEIRGEFDGETGWMEGEPSLDLDIRIPSTIAVERVQNVVGQATVRNVVGDMSIESSTGAIDITDVEGSVDAKSTTGSISISEVSGTVTAQATTGRIEVRHLGKTGDMSTTTGRIEVHVPSIEGDTSISSQTGRIDAAISPTLDAEISAASNTGGVTEEGLPLDDVSKGTRSLDGRLGEGGPTLSLNSQTGRISLSSLD